jgi:hypothetical protein
MLSLLYYSFENFILGDGVFAIQLVSFQGLTIHIFFCFYSVHMCPFLPKCEIYIMSLANLPEGVDVYRKMLAEF